MRINLWYCSDMQQWRWTLTDEKDSMIQESGQRPMIQDAMSDVANTVDYMLQCQQPHWSMTETEPKRKAKLSDSFGGSVEKNIPEDVEWIDDAFYIKKTRFGLHTSILKEPLGQHFITGLEYDDVLTISRWHLKCLQDGSLEEHTRVINDGFVSGKL